MESPLLLVLSTSWSCESDPNSPPTAASPESSFQRSLDAHHLFFNPCLLNHQFLAALCIYGLWVQSLVPSYGCFQRTFVSALFAHLTSPSQQIRRSNPYRRPRSNQRHCWSLLYFSSRVLENSWHSFISFLQWSSKWVCEKSWDELHRWEEDPLKIKKLTWNAFQQPPWS